MREIDIMEILLGLGTSEAKDFYKVTVNRGADCYDKGPEFEFRLRHGCQTVRSRPRQWLRGSALKIGRRAVHIQSSIALVVLAVRSFPWFSSKLA